MKKIQSITTDFSNNELHCYYDDNSTLIEGPFDLATLKEEINSNICSNPLICVIQYTENQHFSEPRIVTSNNATFITRLDSIGSYFSSVVNELKEYCQGYIDNEEAE